VGGVAFLEKFIVAAAKQQWVSSILSSCLRERRSVEDFRSEKRRPCGLLLNFFFLTATAATTTVVSVTNLVVEWGKRKRKRKGKGRGAGRGGQVLCVLWVIWV
jgi:hypothetical protein